MPTGAGNRDGSDRDNAFVGANFSAKKRNIDEPAIESLRPGRDTLWERRAFFGRRKEGNDQKTIRNHCGAGRGV